jgi:hypothetical protein
METLPQKTELLNTRLQKVSCPVQEGEQLENYFKQNLKNCHTENSLSTINLKQRPSTAEVKNVWSYTSTPMRPHSVLS